MAIAVPINHHLANRHQITFSDLYDETIIMFENNDTTNIDEFRNAIELNHPRIHIYDVQPHDFNVFNYAANNGWPMLTIDLWDGIHPALVNIPFYSNKQYTVPYGIIYPNNPKKHIIEFISIIEQFLREY